MNPQLAAAINTQEDWTFEECQGLAVQFSLKTRYVIACVYAEGKVYIDGKRDTATAKQQND